MGRARGDEGGYRYGGGGGLAEVIRSGVVEANTHVWCCVLPQQKRILFILCLEVEKEVYTSVAV